MLSALQALFQWHAVPTRGMRTARLRPSFNCPTFTGNQMIQSLITLFAFQVLGETVAYLFNIPIPGPVFGMLFLFGYLILRGTNADRLVADTTDFLRHLSLLFVPAAVGIMLHFSRLGEEWLPIAVALVISTFASIIVTGLVLKRAGT